MSARNRNDSGEFEALPARSEFEVPWVSPQRMATLQAACAHFDSVVNRGAARPRIPTKTGVRSATIGAVNEVDRAALAKPPVPASPSVEGASDGEG